MNSDIADIAKWATSQNWTVEDDAKGYTRFYNSGGQALKLDGKPGSESETHLPIRPDGTYDLPEGWNPPS